MRQKKHLEATGQRQRLQQSNLYHSEDREVSDTDNIYLRAQRVAAVLRKATQSAHDSERQRVALVDAASVARIHRIEGQLSRKGQR